MDTQLAEVAGRAMWFQDYCTTPGLKQSQVAWELLRDPQALGPSLSVPSSTTTPGHLRAKSRQSIAFHLAQRVLGSQCYSNALLCSRLLFTRLRCNPKHLLNERECERLRKLLAASMGTRGKCAPWPISSNLEVAQIRGSSGGKAGVEELCSRPQIP